MKINYKNQDITTVETGIICSGVNCQGVMGSGLVLPIKEKWPIVYKMYKSYCDSFKYTDKSELVGQTQVTEVSDNLYVANCFTQLTFGRELNTKYASLGAIEESLANVLSFAQVHNIKSIHLPKIGCGLGGLSWEDEVEPIVRKLIKEDLSINWIVYYV